jgi:citrate synthase
MVGQQGTLINVDYHQRMTSDAQERASGRSGPAASIAGRRLDAHDAADRLGVKVETLYAYVSRGLISSERAGDGRSSTFAVRDVERLALRGRPRRSSRGPVIDVSVQTELTEIDGRHLRYRGHEVARLASSASFEQVATLLWDGSLPGTPVRWSAGARLPYSPPVATLLERLRLAVALDACGIASAIDMGADGGASLVAGGPALLATMVDSLPVLVGGIGAMERGSRGLHAPETGRSSTPIPTLRIGGSAPLRGSIAGRLSVRLVERRPTPALVVALNSALVLLADHEMAASTLAARVAASTRADAHAVVSAGMGPVAGALHGRASRSVRSLFAEAERTSPSSVGRRLASQRGLIAGIGHGLYPHGDPRFVALLDAVRRSGAPARRQRLVDEVLSELSVAGVGRPNVDMALGALGYAWDMPSDAGEAIFTVARSAGWLAHGAEEWSHRPLRYRSRARYVGPRP